MGLYNLSNVFGCFSESSSESKRCICDGDVCVLRIQKETPGKKSNNTKQKQSFRMSIAHLSRRMSSRF
ncbi:hypothetical protein L6164_031120 [Bauhinia variegata]|uniref:Uncharacterized protein n=1 Tax=Bauhinia variegata TaxID=167791 RepID=A0ACB9LEG5_BAUVA|nr:hypothetical protein L6164_031120 [Bauhinia variegata]